MNTTATDPAGPDCIVLSTVLPAALARALDAAAGDFLCSRAAAARQLLAQGLRDSGHLPPLDTPGRHRGPRRSSGAAA